MHLKSLEIQGFKSFPERTFIEFHKGVTAIIGPNGSGKSNITDAIRWVLGEQSVKTLRGSRMEDVIFTGTQSRRPMSFAEVTMVIDNSDGKLPLDYTEVQVTRRLYRSGESEYLLNKTTCRLRDITTLFMDTGLGRDGYSIVGQGRVDDILSHRSEDRRRVFEEASGIVKFKTRKEEAERKLLGTEQNLLRINDIINELEQRLEPLAEQAAAAQRYLSLYDELKELDITLMLDSIRQFEINLAETRVEEQLLQDDLNKEAASLQLIKDQNKQSGDRIRQIEDQIEDRQRAFNQISNEISELNGQIALNDEKIHQINRQMAHDADEEKELVRNLGTLDQEISGRKKRQETLKNQLSIYGGQLEAAEKEMQTVLASLGTAERSVEQMKANLDDFLEKLFDKRSLLTQTRGQASLVDSRRKTIADELMQLISDRDRLTLSIEGAETELHQIELTIHETEAAQKQAAGLVNETRDALDSLDKRLAAEKQLLQNKTYRRQTLTELEKNYEGYGEAVRRLLLQAESDQGFAQGIRGTLGSLIRSEKAYEMAIETALGPAIQNIVTDTEQTASRLIDHLKKTRSGRATFLPISSIKGRQLESALKEKISNLPGFINLASELVTHDDDLISVVQFLLGRVVIAENLDLAIAMAGQTGYACRIVTLEGDVINPGGAMTGGYMRSSGTGVLSRPREISELEQEIAKLNVAIADLERLFPELNEKFKTAGRKLAQLEQQAVEIGQLRVREEARLTSLSQDLTKVETRHQMLKNEDDQLQVQSAKIDDEVKLIEQAIQQMEQVMTDLRQTIADQEVATRGEQERRDDLRDRISNLRVSVHSIEESLQAATELADRIEQEKQNQTLRLARFRQGQEDGQLQVEHLTQELVRIREQIEERKTAGTTVSDQVLTLNQEKGRLEHEQASFFDQLEQSTARTTAIQVEIGRYEAKMNRMENQIDDTKNRLWEAYELTAAQAEKWDKPIKNRPEATRRLNQVKNDLKELGPVNLTAIEESQSIQERYTFMSSQRDDIENSRHKLTDVIHELTEAMKKQFVDHFSLINENFKQVFAELFGGGVAEVSLEDEQDVLACGIEIRAQPPGKKLQNLLLLSGGERCLTAIALLFAILRLRPTPFCVLDEVEAALDDANVLRFNDYIRRHSEDAQYILVTHRKGTMEAADRLYGVTMQERGISRILSMKLGE